MRKVLFLASILLYLTSCSSDPKLILVSKDYNQNISKWLKDSDGSIETREFYYIPKDSMDYFLSIADGVVIGGGADIAPSLYNNSDIEKLCETPDLFRDSIECLMINHAVDNAIPLLGICRGQQIINVVLGGTLIRDIPTLQPKSNHRLKGNHPIVPVEGEWLHSFSNGENISVNSRHHQAIDKLADGLKITALSEDGIIESVIWNKDERFIVGVQFHPESVRDQISTKIADLILTEINI